MKIENIYKFQLLKPRPNYSHLAHVILLAILLILKGCIWVILE